MHVVEVAVEGVNGAVIDLAVPKGPHHSLPDDPLDERGVGIKEHEVPNRLSDVGVYGIAPARDIVKAEKWGPEVNRYALKRKSRILGPNDWVVEVGVAPG